MYELHHKLAEDMIAWIDNMKYCFCNNGRFYNYRDATTSISSREMFDMLFNQFSAEIYNFVMIGYPLVVLELLEDVAKGKYSKIKFMGVPIWYKENS